MAEQNIPELKPASPAADLSERPQKLPDELLDKLHDANERFDSARRHREEAIDSSSPETTGREKAGQEFLEAEKGIEEVIREIDRDLEKSP